MLIEINHVTMNFCCKAVVYYKRTFKLSLNAREFMSINKNEITVINGISIYILSIGSLKKSIMSFDLLGGIYFNLFD